ncbi:Protein SDA1 homolog [Caenorhabditis elegans]|uniref:Protein SDA1 homolog n=1 Tax=Caenorhabditis elegans TaxID=6239 RepID=SDA1_CAEEL|nr:Protein SDA1 homolog [Caenorhabditis elegans]Q9NEU2.4 RecName: Full=Protein SDA1 homolog; AltName: Full=Proximal proliferation in germline protein 3 [Caenorhabditis elegans]ABU49431.1 PRO-3 [Caenorhabditis elegans]CAD31812.3 Protein SDA1 homolog [Caenorhabditis elegans]|eukprot:NP_741684.2 Protein SDA1 homolog [Caenorhabditis elegans]
MGKVSKSPGKGEKRIGKVGKKNGKSNAPTEGSNSGKASRFTMSERNLGLMQEIIRKDPESYKEEFLEQFNYFVQTMKLLHLQPEQSRQEMQSLVDSVLFLSGLAKHYPKESKQFSDSLFELLREQGAGLDPEVRMAFCKALVLLRNQDMIDPIILMETFFELVKVEDKVLRKFLLSSISAHLKRVYHKKKDVKMLGKIQNLCFSKMKDSRSIVARAAQLVCIDAFRRKFWRDARTANVIAQACFHKVAKIQVTSMKFFLGSENENGDAEDSDEMDSDAEDNTKTLKEVMTSFRNVKKTRKREKNVERAKKMISKKKKAKKEGRSKECNLMAIQSLYDPQEFVDRLFGAVEAKKMDNFEVRLFKIALCARIIGIHRLHTLSFYSYLHRFLQPKQRDVTKILLYAAQACHEMVPPDTVEQLIRVIANNFVTDRNSPEAMTVGINAIREILSNCPFAATEELLRDLSEYKTYKNKNVSMAARSLITLFRAVNPKLLARKDRGKPQEKDDEDEEYNGFARPKVHDFISGAEILDEDAADGEQGHLEEDGTDSELDVSDVDTDDVDTDDDADEPVAKKKRVEQKSVENDAESDADDEEIEDEEEMDDEEEEIEISDEEEEEIDDEAEEEAVVEEEASEAVEKDPKLKASKNSMDRIMTQEDFKNIKAYQLKKQLIGEKRLKKQMGKGRSQADERIVDEMAEKLELKRSSDGLARLSDIEHFYKKKRQSKEERMADVMAGRADEDYKFGRPKKNGAHVGRTNDQNSKKKVFAMVKNKIRGRNRQRSFRDQQKSLRHYLMRQSGRKPQ